MLGSMAGPSTGGSGITTTLRARPVTRSVASCVASDGATARTVNGLGARPVGQGREADITGICISRFAAANEATAWAYRRSVFTAIVGFNATALRRGCTPRTGGREIENALSRPNGRRGIFVVTSIIQKRKLPLGPINILSPTS